MKIADRGAAILRDVGQNLAVPQGEQLYRTSLNERTRVLLADGSAVTLDSNTRILVRLEAANRFVTLTSGHALFEVAKDPQRPFTVTAGRRTITALGTVFDVDFEEGRLIVTLEEGRVVVKRVGRSEAGTQIMTPNERLSDYMEKAVVTRNVDTNRALSWTQGQLFFDNEPLSTAVNQMNRYSEAKIVIVDPVIADLRINGMFKTGNQAGFIGALQSSLPVEIHTDDKGQILISSSKQANHTS